MTTQATLRPWLDPDHLVSMMSIIFGSQAEEQQRRQKILFFRTITSILSEIPRRVPIAPTDTAESLPKANRETIKVCDAMAQVLVMEHQIMAVTSSHNFVKGPGETLRIVAVSSNDVATGPESKEEPTPPWYIRFLLASNPMAALSTAAKTVVLPTIEKAAQPAGLEKENVLEYIMQVGKTK